MADPIHFESPAERVARLRSYRRAEAERAAAIVVGEALRPGDRVVARGSSSYRPGTVVAVGGGEVVVDQPGCGRVRWSVLDAGLNLLKADDTREAES